MEPLERIKPWVTIVEPSIYSQLLELEFFPKWLNTLHMWLTQPKADFDEVAQWLVVHPFWVDRN